MLQISLYNPGNVSEKDLIENFVIRKEEFNSIFRDILEDEMKSPPQHYLIQGQIGSGKTTLSWRLYYEVKRNEKLNKWLIPVMFNEEEYGIATIYRLWEKIAEYLEDEEELEEFEGIFDEMDKKSSSKNYEEECHLILKRYLENSGKKLVLFIDNFGDILSKLSEQEERRFREVLMTDSNIRIIGASSVVLENTYRYDKPFFEFFKIRNLNGLNTDEVIEFLLQLGEIYKCKEKIENIINNDFARIESLRILTDGVPRTVALLFEIFIDDESGDSFRNLEILLDRVTPLYKHRMDDLPAKQQEIVDVVAFNWDAMGAKEIAEKTRGESKSVSAQLQQLEKNKIIEKKSLGKNNLYQIKERFFNIWYLMRYGRKKERNRVRWLVQFFELWYDKNDFKNRILKHNEGLKNQGKLEEAEEYYKKAIEEGIKEAYNSLAWLYYMSKQRKEEALELSRQAVSLIRKNYTIHTLAMILLWNDEIEEAIELSKEFMTNEESFEEFPQEIMDFLLMLMAKGQYNYLSKLFEENRFNLKDRYKPVYYALIYLKNDKDEYMRIGEELKETVEDIVNRINKMKIEYS